MITSSTTENNTIGGTHLTTLDYGARHYGPIIARWFTTDPMAEKYYSLTPYNYCGNNPMNRIDPDGKEVRIAKEYQRQFINDLQNVFGDRTKMLSFNDNGTLQFES
jgi:RHS repeat-associated protein